MSGHIAQDQITLLWDLKREIYKSTRCYQTHTLDAVNRIIDNKIKQLTPKEWGKHDG